MNLRANEAGPLTVDALSALLQNNLRIKELDLSCNEIGEDGGTLIRQALEDNTTLAFMDMRMSGVSEEEESAMTEILLQRAERKERQTILKQ